VSCVLAAGVVIQMFAHGLPLELADFNGAELGIHGLLHWVSSIAETLWGDPFAEF